MSGRPNDTQSTATGQPAASTADERVPDISEDLTGGFLGQAESSMGAPDEITIEVPGVESSTPEEVSGYSTEIIDAHREGRLPMTH